MPSGIVHDRITLWSLPWIVGATYYLTDSGELTLIVSGSFLFSGLMFGPDLDIYSLQFRRWGVFRWIWLPYQKFLHHRCFLSHGFLIGTLVRLIYLSSFLVIFAFIIVAIIQLFSGINWNWHDFFWQKFNLINKKYRFQVISLFIGLELGASSHYLSDWLVSAYKNRTKKISKKRKSLSKNREW
jgi:uncharacterized metal-binding protein